jgi:hypothetical protein
MTITPEDVFFGPPDSLQYDSVELGASEDPAKLVITVTRYEPDFQGAVGPIKGLTRIVKIKAELTTKLNELALTKLQAALQNTSLASVAGTPGMTKLTQSIGVVLTADHHDVVMKATGPDGQPATVTITDALQTGPITCTFGTTETAGTPVTFTGYGDPANPTLAPYSIERLTV